VTKDCSEVKMMARTRYFWLFIFITV